MRRLRRPTGPRRAAMHWKTNVGRPETAPAHYNAMRELGNGLNEGGHYEDALSVMEAELSIRRRLPVLDENILMTQSNLANTYQLLGRKEQALRMRQDAYSGYAKHFGEEHAHTLLTAGNYAISLGELRRYAEAKSLLRKQIPVARRVLGANAEVTLRMRWSYARALFQDTDATLDDLREAVTTLEDAERIARRVLGGAHPTMTGIEEALEDARVMLHCLEMSSGRSSGSA